MRGMLRVLLNKGNLQKVMKLPTYTVQKQFFKVFKKVASTGSQSVGCLKLLVFNLNSNQNNHQNTCSYYLLFPDCTCCTSDVQFKTFFKLCANQYLKINDLVMKKLSKWEKHDLKCLFDCLCFSFDASQFTVLTLDTHDARFEGEGMAVGMGYVACERNLIRMLISFPFTVIQPASLTLITCSHASPEASHQAHLHDGLRAATWTADARVVLDKSFLSESILGELICVLIVFTLQ